MHTNAITKVLAPYDHKFDLLCSNLMFVHQYVCESMEESEFTKDRKDMETLGKENMKIQYNITVEQTNHFVMIVQECHLFLFKYFHY